MSSTGEAAFPMRRVLVGALTLALVFLAGVVWRQSEARAEECQAMASRPLAHMVHGARRIAVIGDSYTEGYGLADPSQAWTRTLAAASHVEVVADGVGGSGYTAALSSCPAPFTSRVKRVLGARPDLVILEGGLNDTTYSDQKIAAGFRQTAARLRGLRVVVVGPTAAPARLAGARRVDALLARLSLDIGARYVSMVDRRLPFLTDGVHLTPAGHRKFGRIVAKAVR